MLGRLACFPDLFLSTLGLLRRGRGDGDLDSDGLLRRRRGLALLFLTGGLTLRLLAYLRGGDLDRLWESGLGDIRRRLAGGGLRLFLMSLKRRSLSRGGVTDGDRGLRRLGGGVTEGEACRRGLGLRDGDNRLLVGGKGGRERERERELLSRDEERRRGDNLYLRIGMLGELEPRGEIDRERRRGGERETRRRGFYFHYR